MIIKAPEWMLGPREYETEGESRLAKFIDDYNNDREPDQETIEFLVRSFEEILSGVPSKKALALEKKRGRKKQTQRSYRIAFRMANLMELGESYNSACSKVSEEENLDERQVKRLYSEHKGPIQDVFRMNREINHLLNTLSPPEAEKLRAKLRTW